MKYFSMFSGIGGFELGIEYGLQRNLGVEPTDEESRQTEPEIQQRGERSTLEEGHSVLPRNEWSRPICIGYSEIDKYAIQIYERHFNHKNYGDATKINAAELPDFDLLVGGFPCQAFSIAGKRMGLSDTRGTLFYDIARIAEEKRPRHLLLENVKGLLSHDSGRTFKLIISTFAELGYNLEWQVLNSKNFGVPQNRERVFIIGHLGRCCGRQVFPLGQDGGRITKGKSIVSGKIQTEGQQSDSRHVDSEVSQDGEDGYIHQLNQPTHSNGMRIRRLTPTECERLQGFPDGWTEGVSDTQRYKTLGNGVTVNVIEYLIKQLYG